MTHEESQRWIANIGADRAEGDPLEWLLRAARLRQESGHHASCALAFTPLVPPHCSCGFDALAEALDVFGQGAS